MVRISWHPAVVQAFGNELEECRNDLTFEAEHHLTTEPLRIDVLIIKKKRNVVIKKNIAQIFRQYNIIEYKSPTDHVSVEDYHKTHVYARLYATLNKVSINDLSVTVATTRHPRKLLTFLEKQFKVHQEQSGIYLVEGENYPTQVIVGTELSPTDNFWLNNLRNDLTDEQLEQVFMAAKGRSSMNAYIDAIIHANAERMEELQMKKRKSIHELIGEWCGDQWRAEGEAKGRAVGIAEGEARGKIEALLIILRARFRRVPADTEKEIRQMTDPIALDSWTVHAATCASMDEFVQALK